MDDWIYIKLSATARARLTRAIAEKRRENYNGALVRYTSASLNLLSAILAQVDRKTLQARMAFSVLMEETGIASRETIARHLFLLERGGYVCVRRGKIKWDRNAINVFMLVGEMAAVFNPQKWQPARANHLQIVEKHRTDISTIIEPILLNNTDDDDIDTTTSSKVLERVKTFLDGDVAERLVAMRDAEYMTALMDWVEVQAWARNKAGLLYRKAMAGWDPRKEAQGKQSAKPKGKVDYLAGVDALMDEAVLPERVIRVLDAPKKVGDAPEWLAHVNRMLRMHVGHGSCDVWAVQKDGRMVVQYNARVWRHANLIRRLLGQWAEGDWMLEGVGLAEGVA